MEKENLGENTIYDKKSNKQYKLVKQIGQVKINLTLREALRNVG